MSLHIEAKPEDIAETVLLPGDPLRAKFMANVFLEDVRCYNTTRNMLGFTGYHQGQRISIQGTGMGLPSLAIYVNELINNYGAKTLVRPGTCGSFQEHVKVGDLALAMSASCESNFLQRIFGNMTFAPCADFDLLSQAAAKAKELNLNLHVGNVLSSDLFYAHDPEEWKKWAGHGVLGVDMETAMLYTLAAKHRIRALSVLTVSDSLVTGEATSAAERERNCAGMFEVALSCVRQQT